KRVLEGGLWGGSGLPAGVTEHPNAPHAFDIPLLPIASSYSDILSHLFLFFSPPRRVTYLVQSCPLNGNAEFPFGRQWAASVPSAGVVLKIVRHPFSVGLLAN